MATTNRSINRASQPEAIAATSIRVVLRPIRESLDLRSDDSAACISETLPQTFEEAGKRSAERNRAALTELAKW